MDENDRSGMVEGTFRLGTAVAYDATYIAARQVARRLAIETSRRVYNASRGAGATVRDAIVDGATAGARIIEEGANSYDAE